MVGTSRLQKESEKKKLKKIQKAKNHEIEKEKISLVNAS